MYHVTSVCVLKKCMFRRMILFILSAESRESAEVRNLHHLLCHRRNNDLQSGGVTGLFCPSHATPQIS